MMEFNKILIKSQAQDYNDFKTPHIVYVAMIDFERLSRTWEVLAETKEVVGEIMKTSMADGRMDNDEVELLNTISKTVQKYSKLLEKVLEDHQVTDEEYAKIKNFEHKLVKKVYNQVKADGLVSIEEEEMVNTLFNCLSNLEKLEELK
jgi:hypothetical protein